MADQPVADAPHAEEAPPNFPEPTAGSPLYVCPYCGGATPDQPRCPHCRGLMDPLSRQATQNTMGPWFVLDQAQPHRPGCSYSVLAQLVARGRITLDTIIRGPTTHQFWTPAKRVPGVAHLLGLCHSCGGRATPQQTACKHCGTDLTVSDDRQSLGLGPIRLLPGQAPPEMVASSTAATPIPEPRLPQLSGNASGSTERRRSDTAALNALHQQLRRMWTVFGLTLLVLVILIALLAGGVISGVISLNTGPAAKEQQPAVEQKKSPTTPTNTAPPPQAPPQAAPPESTETPPQPRGDKEEPALPAGSASAAINAARQDLLEDTEESLKRAIDRLTPFESDPDAKRLLQTVKLRLEQRPLKNPK